MGTFNSKIVAEFTPPKTWKLEEPLSFECTLINPEIVEEIVTQVAPS